METGDESTSGDESADELISSCVLRRDRDAAIGGTSAPGEPTLEPPLPLLTSFECLFAPLVLRVLLLALAVPFLLEAPTGAGASSSLTTGGAPRSRGAHPSNIVRGAAVLGRATQLGFSAREFSAKDWSRAADAE